MNAINSPKCKCWNLGICQWVSFRYRKDTEREIEGLRNSNWMCRFLMVGTMNTIIRDRGEWEFGMLGKDENEYKFTQLWMEKAWMFVENIVLAL